MRPIEGAQLAQWRCESPPVRGSANHLPYPSQREMAETMGVPAGTWRRWESHGIPPGPWAALVREFFVEEHFAIDYRRAPCEWVKALAALCEGVHHFAEAIGSSHEAVRQWCQRSGGAPLRGGGGPLVRWLFDDLQLDPIDQVPRTRHACKLSEEQVREIRRRHAQGESLSEMVDEYPVALSTLSCVARGESYRWVGRGR